MNREYEAIPDVDEDGETSERRPAETESKGPLIGGEKSRKSVSFANTGYQSTS